MEHEMDRQMASSSALMKELPSSVVVKKKLRQKVQLTIHPSVYDLIT